MLQLIAAYLQWTSTWISEEKKYLGPFIDKKFQFISSSCKHQVNFEDPI